MFEQSKALEHLSNIQDLVDLCDFMDDPKFTEAMELVVKCTAKPDVPPAVARRILMEAQSYAAYFKAKGLVYMTIKQGKAGTEENKKKNCYYSMSEQLHELAQTLKYLAKDASQL